MFLNPWRPGETSAFNIAAARRVLVLITLWRLLSYRWATVTEWPRFVFEDGLRYHLPKFLIVLLPYMGLIAALTAAALLVVLIGRRWQVSAVVAGIGLLILASFHQCMDNQGKRFLVPCLFFILFAVFGRAGEKEKPHPTPAENPLCWILMGLAVTYFLVVLQRLKGGAYLDWTSAENMMRTIRWEALVHLGLEQTMAQETILRHPTLALIAGHGTFLAESALLVAVLFRWRITLPVLALIGMHLGILASMHLVFTGSIGMLLMFLDWERVCGWLPGFPRAELARRAKNVEPPPAAVTDPELVLYDGVCGLCNRFISWVTAHDPRGKFHFAPLQGPTAAARLGETVAEPEDWALILVAGDRTWQRSDAALRIIAGVGDVWLLAYALLIIPRPIRDGCYRWVAKRRYAIFGKSDTCQLPPPEFGSRFLP